MSIRGQPPVSNAELPSVVDHRRIVSGPQKKKEKKRRIVSGSNGYNSLADRTSGRTPASSQSAGPSQRPASQEGHSGNKSYSEDDLQEKSISAIREYYR
jgi:translation initiation factor 4G